MSATTDADPARAAAAQVEAAARNPVVMQAIRAFAAGRPAEAEHFARDALGRDPNNVAALLLLAEVAATAGVLAEAERLLRAAHARLPAHAETALRLADLLQRRGEPDEALDLLDGVSAHDPDDLAAPLARLAVQAQVGDYAAAEAGYRGLAITHDRAASVWIGYGNLLKTLGKTGEAEAAFRRALAYAPTAGEAWLGLANLGTRMLDRDDVATVERLLARRDLASELSAQLHFALGKAREDEAAYALAFEHYRRGNASARRSRPYVAADTTTQVDAAVALFTAQFFAARQGAGDPSAAPIFILGMPRAGSTLLEQMLASHSAIEGTAELPYVPLLAHDLLAARWRERDVTLHRAIAETASERFAVLGGRYLAHAARHRRTGRPHFIDKLPDNWPNIPLIHLMLPNAVIIDARREAMACGFGNYKQLFARGRHFAYDQRDIAAFYRDYVRLTAHVDTVLPGRVIRVEHERLLADPEAVLRDLLSRIGLTWEPACLAFHRNQRPVRTASAAQVREPLSRAGTELWRHYRPWLDEMEDALGSAQ